MFLSAYVRDKETKREFIMVREDYTSKEKFARDIRANGYSVIRISNKRDLAAQDKTGDYATFTEMKKDFEARFGYNREFWADKFELIKEIEAIEL